VPDRCPALGRPRPEQMVVPEVAVVVQPEVADLPENPPVVEADVDRVADREDEEEQEEGQRHRDEGVADQGLAQLGAARRIEPSRPDLPPPCSYRRSFTPAERPAPRGLFRARGESGRVELLSVLERGTRRGLDVCQRSADRLL